MTHPPPVGLGVEDEPHAAEVDLQLVARQDRTAAFETSTDGHHLLGAYIGYTWITPHATYDFFLTGANLTNEDARQHTSFLKDIAPLPGRTVTLGLRATF